MKKSDLDLKLLSVQLLSDQFPIQDRNQEDGGPIWYDLTQALSRMIGFEYDELFIETCEKIADEIKLYERFVDDQNVMT